MIRTRILVAWTLFSLTVVLVPAAVVLGDRCRTQRDLEATRTARASFSSGLGGPAALLFAAVGLADRPFGAPERDRLDLPRLGRAARRRTSRPTATPTSRWAASRGRAIAWTASFTYWSFIPAVFVAPALVAQLFPNGSTAARALAAGVLAHRLRRHPRDPRGVLLDPATIDSYPALTNPAERTGSLGSIARGFDEYGACCRTACFAASVAALVVRFRRSRGIERQQMKWLAFAGRGSDRRVRALVRHRARSTARARSLSVLFITGFAALMLVPVAVGDRDPCATGSTRSTA